MSVIKAYPLKTSSPDQAQVVTCTPDTPNNKVPVDVNIQSSSSGGGAFGFFSTASNPASGVNVTTSSAQVVASKSDRKFLSLCNDSDATIYIAYGSPAALNTGIRLNPRGSIHEINAINLYRGAIFAIHGSTGNKVLGVVEG